MIIQDVDKVNGTNTPTAYKGINRLVCPWKIKIKVIAPIANAIIPLEYPKRSPLSINICGINLSLARLYARIGNAEKPVLAATAKIIARSEEHTSELQSRFDIVCRLLLE